MADLKKLTVDCPNSTRFDSKTHFFMEHLDPSWPTFEYELLCTDPSCKRSWPFGQLLF